MAAKKTPKDQERPTNAKPQAGRATRGGGGTVETGGVNTPRGRPIGTLRRGGISAPTEAGQDAGVARNDIDLPDITGRGSTEDITYNPREDDISPGGGATGKSSSRRRRRES